MLLVLRLGCLGSINVVSFGFDVLFGIIGGGGDGGGVIFLWGRVGNGGIGDGGGVIFFLFCGYFGDIGGVSFFFCVGLMEEMVVVWVLLGCLELED